MVFSHQSINSMTTVKYLRFQENYVLESATQWSDLPLLTKLLVSSIWKGQCHLGSTCPHCQLQSVGMVAWCSRTRLAIDTEQYFVVCVNNPGSPYGSTHPLTDQVDTGTPYFRKFPLFTTRDIAGCFDKLALYLGLENNFAGWCVIGWSNCYGMGHIESVLIWKSGFDSHQRAAFTLGYSFQWKSKMAIEADATFGHDVIQGGANGLKAARSIAMLSYRTAFGYNEGQRDTGQETDRFRAASYQQYQGEKLVNRFDAYSYYALTKQWTAIM